MVDGTSRVASPSTSSMLLQALDYRLVDKVGGDYVYMKGEPI
jgi:hypothetical protein